MNAREKILQRVRASRRETVLAEPWPYPSKSGDLVEQFSQALTAAKGEVFISQDLANAWETLGTILQRLGAKRVVYNQEPPIDGDHLKSRYPQYDWAALVGETQDIKQVCAKADVGITGAAFALAETGSIGIFSSSSSSRFTSLLPEVHVVLLDRQALLPDLISWELVRPKKMPAQLVFVSGPSKTADIEQTLVVGAHGPKRLMVIIYGR